MIKEEPTSAPMCSRLGRVALAAAEAIPEAPPVPAGRHEDSQRPTKCSFLVVVTTCTDAGICADMALSLSEGGDIDHEVSC